MDSLAGSVALADPLSVDVGFQPVFLIGALTSVADSDSVAGLDLTTAYFVSDGTTTLCVAARDTHGAGTMQTARGWSDKVSFVSNSGSLVINGTLTFGVDDFSIDFDAAVGTRYLHYLCVGGDEITAKVVEWDKTGTTGTLDVTSAGFGSPDGAVFLTAHTVSAAPTGLDGDVLHSLGFAKNGGAAHCIGNAHDDNVSNSDTNRSQQSNSVLFHRLGVGGSTALDVQVDSWITDGVRLNFVTNVTSGINGGALFIKGATLNVYGITTDVDGSAHTQQFTGLPARADVGMLISVGDNGFTTEQTHAVTSIGFWDQGLNNAGAGWFAEHASGDSDTRQGGSGNNALYLIHSTVSPYITEMGAVSAVGDTTLDITYPDAALKSTLARQLSVLSFTDSAATVEPTGIATTTVMGAPTLEAGATAEPATIATVSSVGAPEIRTLFPGSVGTVSAIDTPTISTGSTVAPSVVVTVSTVEAASVITGQNPAPDTVSTVSVVGSPTVEAGTTVVAATVSTAATPGGPTVTTGSTATPSAVVTTSIVGSVTFPSVAYRQKKTNFTASGTSVAVTLDLTPVVGNMLLLVASAGNTNAFTLPSGWKVSWGQPQTGSTTVQLTMAWKTVGASEPTTITVSGSGATGRELAVYEIEDMTILDSGSANSTTSATSLSSGTAAMADSDTGVAIAALAVSISGGVSAQNNAWTNGFMREDLVNSRLGIAFKPLTTFTSVSTTETWGAARAATAGVAVFSNATYTSNGNGAATRAAVLATDPIMYVPFDTPGATSQPDLVSGSNLGGISAPVVYTGVGGFDYWAPMYGATDYWVPDATRIAAIKSAILATNTFSAGIWWTYEGLVGTEVDYLFRLWQYGFGMHVTPNNGFVTAFVYDSTGTIRSVVDIGEGTPERGGGPQFSLMAYDGSRIVLYRNGRRVFAGSVLASPTVRIDSATTTFTIGRDGTSANFWPGAVSQFMLWDRALSLPEVDELYKAGLAVDEAAGVNFKRPIPMRGRSDYIPVHDVASVTADTASHIEFIHQTADTRTSNFVGGHSSIGVLDGQIVVQEMDGTGQTFLVERSGDTFTLGASAASTFSPSIPSSAASVLFFPTHATVHAYDFNNSTDKVIDVTVDGTANTAVAGTATNPFSTRDPSSTQATSVSENTRMRRGMVKLDDTHFATYGTYGQYGGYRPFIFLAERSGATPTWSSYGPFPFGKKGQGGSIQLSGYTGNVALVRIDHERMVAIWQTHSDPMSTTAFTGETLQATRPMHAQVLGYDLTSHTVSELSPVYTFEGAGDEYMHVEWLPDANVAVVFALAYDAEYPDDANNRHISATSLRVDGTVVTQAIPKFDIAGMLKTTDNPWDFFYNYAVVGLDDVYMVVYNDVNDYGGDVRYAIVQVSTSGASRGALRVVDDGVLITGALSPDNVSFTGDYEMWPNTMGADIGNGERLLLFERYSNDWTEYEYNFILARRAT